MIFVPFSICVDMKIYNCFLTILEQYVLADVGEPIHEYRLLRLDNCMTYIDVAYGSHCPAIPYTKSVFNWAMYTKFHIGHDSFIFRNHTI